MCICCYQGSLSKPNEKTVRTVAKPGDGRSGMVMALTSCGLTNHVKNIREEPEWHVTGDSKSQGSQLFRLYVSISYMLTQGEGDGERLPTS